MKPLFVIIIAGLVAGPVAAQDVALPSGQTATFVEMIAEQGILRMRYLAPWIAEGLDEASLTADTTHLCNQEAAPLVGATPTEVVISLSAAEIVFGESNPDVVQVFVPFTIDAGQCIGEAY